MFNQEENRKVFDEICKEMGDLYDIKNTNYKGAFAEQFKEEGLSYVAPILGNKVRRVKAINMSQLLNEEFDFNGESLEDTLKDMANYCIMTLAELRKQG